MSWRTGDSGDYTGAASPSDLGGMNATTQVSKAAVRVRGLRRTYGHGPAAYEAVRGVDLDVPTGSITALLGTNGAGQDLDARGDRGAGPGDRR